MGPVIRPVAHEVRLAGSDFSVRRRRIKGLPRVSEIPFDRRAISGNFR